MRMGLCMCVIATPPMLLYSEVTLVSSFLVLITILDLHVISMLLIYLIMKMFLWRCVEKERGRKEMDKQCSSWHAYFLLSMYTSHTPRVQILDMQVIAFNGVSILSVYYCL